MTTITKKKLHEYRQMKTLYWSEKDCDIPRYKCVYEEYIPGPDMDTDRFYLQRIWVNPEDKSPYVLVEWRQCPNGSFHEKVKYTEVTE